MMGQFIALGPRCLGRRDGWYWMVPLAGVEENLVGDDVGYESHDTEVDVQASEGVYGILAPHAAELEYGDFVVVSSLL